MNAQLFYIADGDILKHIGSLNRGSAFANIDHFETIYGGKLTVFKDYGDNHELLNKLQIWFFFKEIGLLNEYFGSSFKLQKQVLPPKVKKEREIRIPREVLPPKVKKEREIRIPRPPTIKTYGSVRRTKVIFTET